MLTAVDTLAPPLTSCVNSQSLCLLASHSPHLRKGGLLVLTSRAAVRVKRDESTINTRYYIQLDDTAKLKRKVMVSTVYSRVDA